MEKRNSPLEHEQPMEQTRDLFCTCDSDVARCLYFLVNEFDVRNVLHGHMSLEAVNHNCVIHEAMNGCKNLDSIKDCFENVNILK